ncbi:aryl-alcohol dehydrogenase-like predicted oxidoreductase [Kitasatospora kifunensis]|uniref:Aryl-alcohol dehydrogenase-like predicted oxidoreductase n=2 Tax=Kitasatospora kifunensis TaxID=58351 RepID=A0A7W7R7W8_KITKI|nr:aryl-alcohol dehydrogenase-like predicted oxidoreductase [Kitasatospora kifunensis]
MQLTGDGVWGPPRDSDQATRVLRVAVDLGANFIDTADAYGPHLNEALIAEALYPYRGDLVVATKGGLVRSGPNSWTCRGEPAYLRTCVEASLQRLRTDCIDLYQLHRADPAVPLLDQIGALSDLQAQGKIRHIGLSNVSVQQYREVVQHFTIASVQGRFHLLDHRANVDVVRECERDGIAFIACEPLFRGHLSRTNRHLGRLTEKAGGASPAQLALAWVLHYSRSIVAIPGTSSTERLAENIDALSAELPPEVKHELIAAAGGW